MKELDRRRWLLSYITMTFSALILGCGAETGELIAGKWHLVETRPTPNSPAKKPAQDLYLEFFRTGELQAVTEREIAVGSWELQGSRLAVDLSDESRDQRMLFNIEGLVEESGAVTLLEAAGPTWSLFRVEEIPYSQLLPGDYVDELTHDILTALIAKTKSPVEGPWIRLDDVTVQRGVDLGLFTRSKEKVLFTEKGSEILGTPCSLRSMMDMMARRKGGQPVLCGDGAGRVEFKEPLDREFVRTNVTSSELQPKGAGVLAQFTSELVVSVKDPRAVRFLNGKTPMASCTGTALARRFDDGWRVVHMERKCEEGSLATN